MNEIDSRKIALVWIEDELFKQLEDKIIALNIETIHRDLFNYLQVYITISNIKTPGEMSEKNKKMMDSIAKEEMSPELLQLLKSIIRNIEDRIIKVHDEMDAYYISKEVIERNKRLLVTLTFIRQGLEIKREINLSSLLSG